MIAPLANFLAVEEPHPEAAAEISASLATSGQFDEVFSPRPDWIVAVKRLPDSTPDGDAWRSAGFIFAQGRDVLEGVGPTIQRALGDDVRRNPEGLDRYPGDFTFIHFQDRAITAVRSVAGSVPIYYWQRSGRWRLATRFEHIYLPHLGPERIAPDPLCCAMALFEDFAFPPPRTPLLGVEQVQRGHYAVLEAKTNRVVSRPYWTAPAGTQVLPSTSEIEETVLRFREALLRNLERQTHEAKPNLLALSGGVDSSTLAYLLTNVLGRRLWTITGTLKDTKVRQRELSYVNPVLKDCSAERAWFAQWDEEAFLTSLEQPRTLRFPAFTGILDTALQKNRSEPVSTFFGGDLADEICGSVRSFPDWSLSVRIADLFLLHPRWPGGFKAMPRWVKHQLLNLAQQPLVPRRRGLPAYFKDAIRAEYREEYARAIGNWKRMARFRPYLAASIDIFSAGAASGWEIASSHSLRMVHPFISRELIELALATHPSVVVGPGIKLLLRRAFKGEVPARSLERSDKGVSPYEYERRTYHPPRCGWAPTMTDLLAGSVRLDLKGLHPAESQQMLILDHFIRGLVR